MLLTITTNYSVNCNLTVIVPMVLPRGQTLIKKILELAEARISVSPSSRVRAGGENILEKEVKSTV